MALIISATWLRPRVSRVSITTVMPTGPSGKARSWYTARMLAPQDVPPLPEQIVLPMPPEHRIARHAEQVPISAEHWSRAPRSR